MQPINSTDNEIDKAAFLLLTEEDLKSLLPDKMGPRKKIWDFIRSVHEAPTSVTFSDTNSDTFSVDQQVDDIQSASTTSHPHIIEPIISEPLDVNDEITHPVTTLTKYSPNIRTEYAPSSYDCVDDDDDETIGSTIEPTSSQLVYNRMNQLTLNVQLINQHHNQYLHIDNHDPNSNQFVAKEVTKNEIPGTEHQSVEHNAEEQRQVKQKLMEHKYVDRSLVRAGQMQQKQFNNNDNQQKKQPTSKKGPHSTFKSDRKLPIYHYKRQLLQV